MAVGIAWKRTEFLGRTKVLMYGVTAGDGDTSAVIKTGLRRIFSYSVSPTSVVAKYVTRGQISGGTLTLTLTDPEADEYFTVTVFGH